MPFISQKKLEHIRQEEYNSGRANGHEFSKAIGRIEGQNEVLDKHGKINARLDALDLVIDQFHIRDQYPDESSVWFNGGYDYSYAKPTVTRGAQRFYDDLVAAAEFNTKVAAAEFNTKADAAERIALAADRASSLNGEDFE